jgi:hypothetical protein
MDTTSTRHLWIPQTILARLLPSTALPTEGRYHAAAETIPRNTQIARSPAASCWPSRVDLFECRPSARARPWGSPDAAASPSRKSGDARLWAAQGASVDFAAGHSPLTEKPGITITSAVLHPIALPAVQRNDDGQMMAMSMNRSSIALGVLMATLFGSETEAAATCNHVPALQWLACLDAKPHRCNINDLTEEILAEFPVKDTEALARTLLMVRDKLRCRPSEE